MSHYFDSKVLNLVKQKGFCSYENMIGFEKSTERFFSQWKIYNSWIDKKECGHAPNVWDRLVFKSGCSIVSWCVHKNLEIPA